MWSARWAEIKAVNGMEIGDAVIIFLLWEHRLGRPQFMKDVFTYCHNLSGTVAGKISSDLVVICKKMVIASLCGVFVQLYGKDFKDGEFYTPFQQSL